MTTQPENDFFLYQIGLDSASEGLWVTLLKENPNMTAQEAKSKVAAAVIAAMKHTIHKYPSRSEWAEAISQLLRFHANMIRTDGAMSLDVDMSAKTLDEEFKP